VPWIALSAAHFKVENLMKKMGPNKPLGNRDVEFVSNGRELGNATWQQNDMEWGPLLHSGFGVCRVVGSQHCLWYLRMAELSTSSMLSAVSLRTIDLQ